MKIKLGVLFGGPTTEHEISIITALQAIEHLNKDKYDIVPIYIAKDREWYSGIDLLNIDNYKDIDNLLSHTKKVCLYQLNGQYVIQKKVGLFRSVINTVDLVMPIVHGYNMEDGNIEGYLDTLGIPYTGSDIFGCVVGQDKVFQKQILESCNIPVLPYDWFYDIDYLDDADLVIKKLEKIGYPLIVKPSRQGSSIGIGTAKNKTELISAIDEAIKYDDKIVVEKMLSDFIELNCSVLGSPDKLETSLIEEVMGEDEILSYADKYLGNSKTKGSKGMASTNRIIPARIDSKATKKIEDISINAFKALGASGVVRIDYLMDKKSNKVYLNELNTIPGSLSFYLWQPKGKTYGELLDELIDLSIKRYKKKQKKTDSFNTNVLNSFSGSKGLKGMKGNKF